MLSADALERLLAAIGASGTLRAPRRVVPSTHRGRAGAGGIEGTVTIAGRAATIRVELGQSFPLTLPKVRLVPWDALGFIPHVAEDGYVCYADSEGLVLDRARPLAIIEWAMERAVEVLRRGVEGENRLDFVDEFETYWLRFPGVRTYTSLIDPGDEARPAIVASSGDRPAIVALKEEDLVAFQNGARLGARFNLRPALYIPLEAGTAAVPPRWDRPFWTAADLRALIRPSLSDENLVRLDTLTDRARGAATIVVRLLRPTGGATLVGVRYEGVWRQDGRYVHPLREGGNADRITPIALERQDHAYLVPRGGGALGVRERHVLLVGAGAVGGHLAFELARGGVREITIVDHDSLAAENTYRHVLGRRFWGTKKATALKRALEADYPYLRVTAVTDKVQDALGRIVHVDAFDMVVSAIGNPTVELELNEYVHTGAARPSAVFTWLEPYGIGGHALLAHHAAGGGCFACLYATPAGDPTLVNRAAFAKQGQSFGKALSGCGSLHTPYGSIDAVRTAALAAQLVLDAIGGREVGNALRSWRGDAAALVDAGFALAPRYHFTDAVLRQQRYSYRVASCPVCGQPSAARQPAGDAAG